MTVSPPKLITWSDQYSVEVSSIDAQHQKLIGFINDLHAAMAARQGSAVAGKILNGLVAYTVTHFSFEEGLLATKGYPDLAAHKAEHSKLMASVKKLQQEFQEGKITLSLELMRFLKSWLMDHIAGVDKKYTVHLHAAGVR